MEKRTYSSKYLICIDLIREVYSNTVNKHDFMLWKLKSNINDLIHLKIDTANGDSLFFQRGIYATYASCRNPTLK